MRPPPIDAPSCVRHLGLHMSDEYMCVNKYFTDLVYAGRVQTILLLHQQCSRVYIGVNTCFRGSPKAEGAATYPALLTIHMRCCHGNFTNICVVMTALVVLATAMIGGIYIYKHMT